MTTVVALLVALLGGVVIAFQSPLASLMSARIGGLESAFIVHLGGTVLAGVLLVPFLGGHLSSWRTVPWYALASGALGIGLVLAVSYTIPRIGVATTFAAVISAQLAIGLVLDHFGLLGTDVRPLDLTRAAGVAILLLGTWIVSR